MKPDTTEPEPSRTRRLLWFAGLSLSSVLALSLVALALRWVLLG